MTLSRDEEHLNLLAIFHYVVAAMTGCGACIPIVHVGLGLAMINGAFPASPQPPPPVFGWFFVVIGSAVILIGWAISVLLFVAGRRLKARRSRTFCMVAAAIACTMMPFGTVLGVFTLIALSRDSVRALFDARGPAAS